MGETIVEARHLSHRYATQWAIQDINFEISQRGILGYWVLTEQVNRRR